MTEDVKRIIAGLREGACCSVCNCAFPTIDYPYPCEDRVVTNKVMDKAADLIEQLAEREWELFDLITSVYHGKTYYFKQDDGTIYSRDSGQYMTFDQAIDEFCGRLSND